MCILQLVGEWFLEVARWNWSPYPWICKDAVVASSLHGRCKHCPTIQTWEKLGLCSLSKQKFKFKRICWKYLVSVLVEKYLIFVASACRWLAHSYKHLHQYAFFKAEIKEFITAVGYTCIAISISYIHRNLKLMP